MKRWPADPTAYRSALLVVWAMSITACAFEPGAPPDPALIEEAACQRMDEGPGQPILASDTADGAPALSEERLRYDILGLAESAYVTLENEREGLVYLFLRSGADVRVVIGADEEIALHRDEPQVCPDSIAAVIRAELAHDRYTLELTGVTDESIVLSSSAVHSEDGEHDHDHDHDH